MSLETKIEELTAAVTRLTETLLRDAPQYQTPEEKKSLKAAEKKKTEALRDELNLKTKKFLEETVDIEELIEEADEIASNLLHNPEDNFDIEDEEVVLDAETVKSLAKKKMTDGSIQRDVLKAEVKKLGADMISELKAEALVKLYDKLNNLKK